MNVTKCINGHFFDADKSEFCPHCGATVNEDNKLNEKSNRPDMVMGMMKPPEPVIRGNMRCVDEFIAEDPISEMDDAVPLEECKHEFEIVQKYTNKIEYKCIKCGEFKEEWVSQPTEKVPEEMPKEKTNLFKKLFSKKNGWGSIHRLASQELKKVGKKNCVFHCDCTVDVRNFHVESPSGSFGYSSSANILVFCDGMISVLGPMGEERFHISSVINYNDNIGNYNPSHENEVKFILDDKCIVIGFYQKDKNAKKELTEKLKQVYSIVK